MVEYEDHVVIKTPEGVDLELTLAGVGSRFTSALVDLAIQSLLLLALFVVFAVGGFGSLGGVAVFTVVGFAVFAGYDILFEVFSSGKTPGKRLNGLRVVRDDGRPVGFLTSTVRNVLRLVDILPSAYLVGIISILVTRQNQRIGDVAAGTIVVRERRATQPLPRAARSVQAPAPVAWDLSALTADDLVAVRLFLERRHELDWNVRSARAQELARALLPKVAGVPSSYTAEQFLEQVAAAKGGRAS